ncbi:MAG: serine hydrolase [Isosphaeraceae bacterium]|nr:serine hydrolase [Isosphaeraceae bacterium]
MRIRFSMLLFGVFVSSVGICSGGDSLEARIRPLIESHKGEVAVSIRHLATGESFTYKDRVVMPTASLIKFPVMIEAYRQAKEGKIDLKRPVVLRKEDKVPGSGILTSHFSEGATIPLIDAIHLMIVFSDNTATNLVLDAIGLDATARTMESMGLPETKVHSKVYRRDTSVFPERSKKYGLGSTTAADMIELLEKLNSRTLVSPEASDAMLEHMKGCDDDEKFPRFLPPGMKLAFKTGSVDAARTAAGILYTDSGPVAVCVLTDRNEDRRWIADNAGNRLCALVAREVASHFANQSSRTKSADSTSK